MLKTILFTLLLSVLPISELRGAIPYAYFNGMALLQAAAIAVVANALVAPAGFIFFNTLHKLFSKWAWYRKLFDKTIARARAKIEGKVQKYGILGLMAFVAIPLPITGAWTGVLGAWALGLDKKKSCLSIALGVLIAGIIVSTVVLTGSSLASLFTKTVSV